MDEDPLIEEPTFMIIVGLMFDIVAIEAIVPDSLNCPVAVTDMIETVVMLDASAKLPVNVPVKVVVELIDPVRANVAIEVPDMDEAPLMEDVTRIVIARLVFDTDPVEAIEPEIPNAPDKLPDIEDEAPKLETRAKLPLIVAVTLEVEAIDPDIEKLAVTVADNVEPLEIVPVNASALTVLTDIEDDPEKLPDSAYVPISVPVMEDTPEIEELKEKAPDAVADILDDPLILDDTAKLPLIVLVIEELPDIDPASAYDPLTETVIAEVVDIVPPREKLAVPIAFSVVLVAIVPKLAIVLYDVVDIAELPVNEPLTANDPLIVEVIDELLESVPLNAKDPLTVTLKLDVVEIVPTSLLSIVTDEFVMLEEAPNDPVMIVAILALAPMNDPDPYVSTP